MRCAIGQIRTRRDGQVRLLRLLGAFEIERETGHRWTFGGLALGSVEVVLGLILLVSRAANAEELAAVLAVWGLVGGSLLLIEGFQLRRLARLDHLDDSM